MSHLDTNGWSETDASSAAFNDIAYTVPNVPALYTALTTGANATSVGIYGDYTNSYVLRKDEIVEIVLNNYDTGKHPFHLHGHNFQTIWRGAENDGVYNSSWSNATDFPVVPMRRDVLMVKPLSNFVIRFKADNPGE